MAVTSSGTDLNGKIAGLLRDLAAVQTSTQRRWGYKRAAAAGEVAYGPIPSLAPGARQSRSFVERSSSPCIVRLTLLRPVRSNSIIAATLSSEEAFTEALTWEEIQSLFS